MLFSDSRTLQFIVKRTTKVEPCCWRITNESPRPAIPKRMLVCGRSCGRRSTGHPAGPWPGCRRSSTALGHGRPFRVKRIRAYPGCRRMFSTRLPEKGTCTPEKDGLFTAKTDSYTEHPPTSRIGSYLKLNKSSRQWGPFRLPQKSHGWRSHFKSSHSRFRGTSRWSDVVSERGSADHFSRSA